MRKVSTSPETRHLPWDVLRTMQLLKKNQSRPFFGLIRTCATRAGVCGDRFQAILEDADLRKACEEDLIAVLAKHIGRFNPFNKDATTKQTFFEPKNWARPIKDQIESLEVYLSGITVDPDYLAKRMAEPVPAGFTRVAVPKLAFLQKFLEVDDIYAQIGKPIEHVTETLEGKHGDKFKNWRKGELGTDRVRCHEAAAAQRKLAEEAVPGDILILDVDLGNRTLGGKDKLCHTPRWSREEIGISENLMHLSAVDVGWMLVINPDRLTKYEDLSIDVTLEEYFWDGRGWVHSLCFDWIDGQLHFDHRYAAVAYKHFAAGVALLSGVAGNSDSGNSA